MQLNQKLKEKDATHTDASLFDEKELEAASPAVGGGKRSKFKALLAEETSVSASPAPSEGKRKVGKAHSRNQSSSSVASSQAQTHAKGSGNERTKQLEDQLREAQAALEVANARIANREKAGDSLSVLQDDAVRDCAASFDSVSQHTHVALLVLYVGDVLALMHRRREA